MKQKVCPKCWRANRGDNVNCYECNFLFAVGASEAKSPQGIASSSGSPSDAPSVTKLQCVMGASEVSKPSHGKAEGESLDLSRLIRLPVSGSAVFCPAAGSGAFLKDALGIYITPLHVIEALEGKKPFASKMLLANPPWSSGYGTKSRRCPQRSGGKRRKVNNQAET
jgi:hypothetical protein